MAECQVARATRAMVDLGMEELVPSESWAAAAGWKSAERRQSVEGLNYSVTVSRSSTSHWSLAAWIDRCESFAHRLEFVATDPIGSRQIWTVGLLRFDSPRQSGKS